jgi:hypothetical protein
MERTCFLVNTLSIGCYLVERLEVRTGQLEALQLSYTSYCQFPNDMANALNVVSSGYQNDTPRSFNCQNGISELHAII